MEGNVMWLLVQLQERQDEALRRHGDASVQAAVRQAMQEEARQLMEGLVARFVTGGETASGVGLADTVAASTDFRQAMEKVVQLLAHGAMVDNKGSVTTAAVMVGDEGILHAKAAMHGIADTRNEAACDAKQLLERFRADLLAQRQRSSNAGNDEAAVRRVMAQAGRQHGGGNVSGQASAGMHTYSLLHAVCGDVAHAAGSEAASCPPYAVWEAALRQALTTMAEQAGLTQRAVVAVLDKLLADARLPLLRRQGTGPEAYGTALVQLVDDAFYAVQRRRLLRTLWVLTQQLIGHNDNGERGSSNSEGCLPLVRPLFHVSAVWHEGGKAGGTIELSVAPTKMSDALLGLIRNDLTRYLMPEFTMAQLLKVGVTAKEGVRMGGGMPRDRMKGDTTVQHAMDALSELLVRCSLELTNALHEVQEAYKEVTTALQQVVGTKKAPPGGDGEVVRLQALCHELRYGSLGGDDGAGLCREVVHGVVCLKLHDMVRAMYNATSKHLAAMQQQARQSSTMKGDMPPPLVLQHMTSAVSWEGLYHGPEGQQMLNELQEELKRRRMSSKAQSKYNAGLNPEKHIQLVLEEQRRSAAEPQMPKAGSVASPFPWSKPTATPASMLYSTTSASPSASVTKGPTTTAKDAYTGTRGNYSATESDRYDAPITVENLAESRAALQKQQKAASAKEQGSSIITTMRGQQEVRRMPYEARQVARAATMTGHDSSGRAEAAMPSMSQTNEAVSMTQPAVVTRPGEGSKVEVEHATSADKAMPASHASAGPMQQEASSLYMPGSASAALQLPSGAVQHEACSMAGDMAISERGEAATLGTAAETTVSEGRDVAEEGMRQSPTGQPSMGSTYNERLEGLLRQYPFLHREPCPGVYLDEVPFEQNMRFSAAMNRLLMKKSSLTQRSDMSEVTAQERAVNDVVTELARELQQRTLETYLSMPFLDLRVHGVLLGTLAQLFEEDGRFRALQLVRRQMIRSAAVTRGGNKQRVLNTEKCLREQAELLASTLPGVEEERAARSVATLRAMAGNMAATTATASPATSDSPSSDTLTPPPAATTVSLAKDNNAATTTTVTHKPDSVTTATPSATTTPEAARPEAASPNAAPTITATVTTTYRPPTRPDKSTRPQGVPAGQPPSSSTGTSVTRTATATSTSVAAATKQPVPQPQATTNTPVTGTMPTATTTTTPTTTTVTKAPSVTSVRSVQRKASDAVISVILPAEQYAVNANTAYDGPTVVSPQEAAPLDSTASTKDTTAPRADMSSDNGVAARPSDESSSPHTPQEPHARSGLRPPPHHTAPPQTPAATAAPPTNLTRSSTRPPQPSKASATQQETASQTTVKAAQEKGLDTQPTTAGHPTSATAMSEPQAMSTSATADVPALSSSSSATKLPALTPASRDHSPLSTHSKAKSQGSTGSRNGHTPSLPSQRRPSSNCGRPAYTATMTISNKRTVPTVVTLSRPGDAKAKTIVTNAPVVLPTVSLSGQPGTTTTTQPPASQLTPNALHEGQADSVSTRDATKPTAARDDGKESVADKSTSEAVPRRDDVAETTKAVPITAAAAVVSNEVDQTPLKDRATSAETTKVTSALTPQPPTSSPLTKKPSSLYVADLSKSSVVITAHVPPTNNYPTTTNNNNGQSPGTTPAPVRSLYTLATEEAAKRVAVYQQQQRSAAASPTANGQPRSDSQDSPSSRLRSPGHGTGAAMTMAEAARSVGQNAAAATTTRTHLAGSTMMMMTDQTSYGSIGAAAREETDNDNNAAMTTHAETHITQQQQSEVDRTYATGQRAEDMDAARAADTANVAQQHLQQQQQADAARASVIAAWVQRVGQQARLSERPQSEPHELSRHREETWKSRTFGSMPSNAAHANSPAAVGKTNTGNEATGEMARAMALTQPVSAPTIGGSMRPADKSGSGSYGGGVLRSLTQAERQSVVPLFPEYRSRWTQSSRAEANNNTDNNTTSYLPALLQRSQSRGFAYGTALQQQHALNSPTTTVPRSPALDEVSCCSGGSVSFSQMQRSPQGGSLATDWRSTTSGQTTRGKVNSAARGRPSAEGNNNNETEGGEAKTNYFRSSSPYEALLQQQNEQLTRNTAVGSKEAFLRRRSPASRVGTPSRFPDSPAAAAAASEAASRLNGGDHRPNDTTTMSLNATNASMAATTATAGSTTPAAAAAMKNNTTTSPPRSPRLAYHNSNNNNGFAASTSISLGLPAAYLTTRPPLSFPLATTALSEVYTRACQELNMRPNSGLLRTFPSKPAVWLDKLDLSVNYVGNKGMRPILYVLEHNGDHLVLLNLSNNNLDNAEVLELIAVLAGAAGCNLATLDLSYNPFSQTAGQALLRLCTSRPNLTTIRIRGTLLPPKLMQAIEDQVEDNAFRKHLQQTS